MKEKFKERENKSDRKKNSFLLCCLVLGRKENEVLVKL